MSKGNYSCNRAVIFESAVILLLSLFWNNHLLHSANHNRLLHNANHNRLLHNANHNHISTTKTTPLLTTFATKNDIPPSSPQTPPFQHRQQRPHRATSLPTDAGGSLMEREPMISATSACWGCLLQRPLSSRFTKSGSEKQKGRSQRGVEGRRWEIKPRPQAL